MQESRREQTVIQWFSNLVKKPPVLQKEQLGIYHYVWMCDTLLEDSHGLKYDVYAKVKIVEIYQDLVEIQEIDIKINDSASVDVINMIKNNFPKYVNPKYVKWQIIK